MAFFWKADAKVRQIFEPPKLFPSFFEKFLFQSRRSVSSSMLQYFITTPFLSRKRMQNYCFTTYLPNLCNHFFQTFCKLFANSLICRCVLRQGFSFVFQGKIRLHLNFITRTRIYAHFHIHKARKKRSLTHLKFVKENSLKLQGLFQKALDL